MSLGGGRGLPMGIWHRVGPQGVLRHRSKDKDRDEDKGRDRVRDLQTLCQWHSQNDAWCDCRP